MHGTNDLMERFLVRSRQMTVNPRKNKYVKNYANVNEIQDYLTDQTYNYNDVLIGNKT